MSLHVKIEDPKCMGTAEEAIGEGLGVRLGADRQKVGQYDSAGADVFYGIAAEAADADGDGIRFYGPGEYCRAVCGEALDIASGEEETKLTLNSAGKLVKAAASQPVHAIWCPKPGSPTAAADDFIIVLVAGWAERLLDA
jgi:hypothetical protein